MPSIAASPADSLTLTISRVPALLMRKALVGSALLAEPASEAVRVIEELLFRAPSADAAKDSLLAMAAWQIDLRDAETTLPLQRLRDAARELESEVVAALFDDAAPHRSLSRHGRLREIGMPERIDFGFVRRVIDWPPTRQRFLEAARLHHSPIMIARLLEQRWLTLGDALLIAARRPTTAPIAFAAVRSERWFRHTRYREALAMNPFTPTGVSLALLPTLPRPVIEHLASAGDVHPMLAATASGLLRLQRG